MISAGQIKEYDEPYRLLQDHSSLLKKLVDQTRPSVSRKLLKFAEDTHIGHELVPQKRAHYSLPSESDLDVDKHIT